jgi:TPR repeat protein
MKILASLLAADATPSAFRHGFRFQFPSVTGRGAMAAALLAAGLALGTSPARAQAEPEWLTALRAKAKAGDADAMQQLAGNLRGQEAIDMYKRAAALGNEVAQYELGKDYSYGFGGVQADGQEAVKYLTQASARKILAADVLLGEIYEEGKPGVPVNLAEALKWYQGAANQDAFEAQYRLGMMYLDGRGVKKDAVEGARWIQRSARNEYGQAKEKLTQILEADPTLNTRLAAAGSPEFATLLAKAEKGDAQAQFDVGRQFLGGKGSPLQRDETASLQWLRKSAAQNHAPAIFWVGLAYQDGNGVTMDDAEAAKWLRRAADLKLADAQFALGWYYTTGRGLERNMDEAMKLFLAAAEQGDINAAQSLGHFYQDGSVDKNPAEAEKWSQKAADAGNVSAMTDLGLVLIDKKDFAGAKKWLAQAAAKGDGTARKKLDELPDLERSAAEKGTATQFLRQAQSLMYVKADPTEPLKKAIAIAETGTPEVRFVLGMMLAGQGYPGIPPDRPRGLALVASAAKDNYTAALWTYGSGLMGGLPDVTADPTAGTAMLAKAVAQADDSQTDPEIKYVIGATLLKGGPGVTADPAHGLKLIGAAADGDNPRALLEFARALVVGAPNIPADGPRGIAYFKRAAALNLPGAAFNLGVIYERGLGGTKADPKEALTWYQQSAAHGEAEGQTAVKRLEAAPAAAAATAAPAPASAAAKGIPTSVGVPASAK